MRANLAAFAGLLSLAATASAAPTWPASTDEMEEIMYQLYGFKARLFADKITPCSNEASGPGRQNAAEWLRTAFHDMSTANTYFGIGGLDASLAFELKNTENTGPGHNSTMVTFSDFVSPRSSMSDLIAAGVYASVRVCGGPIVPVKGGRVDATEAGSPGVPQPQNDISTFRNQFDRMGFTPTQMIQVVACGHTLGGVHSAEFPALVPAGTATNDEGGLDTTVAAFDNNVVTEYVNGTTKNPLVVGPSVKISQNSDFVVFNSDSNVTVKAMTAAAAFQSTCATVLQKMIEVVPAGVVLTDVITPYTVKPVDLQLTLNSGAATIALSGYIRVRTNDFAQSISSITLNYKNRSGATGGTTTATLQGTGTGLDDNFNFYPIAVNIPASTGISSFTVTLTFADSTTQVFDNNGNSFPVSDAVMLQTPQSCLLQGTGALTVTAAVRNDRTSLPANVTVYYQTPRTSGIPLPKTTTASVALTKGACVGAYTLYSASYAISGGRSYAAKLDIISGSGTNVVSDSFKSASTLAGTCGTFTGSSTCGNVSVTSTLPSSTSSVVSSSSSVVSSSSTVVSSSSSATSSSSVASSTTLITSTLSSSSAGPSATLAHKATVGGYNLVSCWTEGTGVRALSGASFAYDGMTLESCAGNCSGFAYWGTEYGRECYCGNSLAGSSSSAPLSDCNMVCGGNSFEYCGAGNRLELYLTTISSMPTATATSSVSSSTVSSAVPTGTLGVKPTVGKYSFVGCWTEGTGVRALSSNSYADDGMTLESCAAFCSTYKYFATEYGRECYCGDALADSSVSAAAADCNMVCAGNPYEYCGAGNRLELYSLAAASSSASSSSTTLVTSDLSSSTSSVTPTTLSSSVISSSSSVAVTSSSSSSSSSVVISSTSSSSSSTSATSSSSVVSSSFSSTAATSSSSVVSSSSSSSVPSTSSSSSSVVASSTSSTASPSTTSSAVSSSSSSSASSTTPSTSTSSTLAHKPTVSPYTLVGCYTEGTGVRALSASSYASGDSMTLEACAAFCSSYRYFGAEYASECYCGDTLASSSAAAPLADCSMPCSGNPFEYCGAGNRLELYLNNATVVPSGPTQPAAVAGYAWYGCRTEGTAGRALSAASYAADDVTLESCAAFCADYTYFGAEYGRECYCGDSFAAGSVAAPDGDCSMTCAGDSKEYCGAGDRLSVYEKA
ncbi:WSC domain-containing protein [Pleurostoma richardsiae]|uniref:WSC domain-containing protein n=1 Tax=Pleurostoma richardsiae TaxID=41990 RepID=A0AA38S0K6_9PEZI|nr:WSC domain-containing protein [Pleurostoma richardsiae]